MQHHPHILIVEDDTEIRTLVCEYLNRNGFDARGVESGSDMDQALLEGHVDLIVLDVNLPGGEDGLSICRRMRAKSDVPILMLTARSDDIDRIVGLEVGADDYMGKPFNPRELSARIGAILRRAGGNGSKEQQGKRRKCGHIIVDPDRREVSTEDGDSVVLTSGEFALLAIFMARPQRVLERDMLMDLLNGRQFDGAFDRSIDVQVSRLRKKIETDASRPALIKTIRNGGYMLSESVQDI